MFSNLIYRPNYYLNQFVYFKCINVLILSKFLWAKCISILIYSRYSGPGSHIVQQNSEEISETLLTANGLPSKYFLLGSYSIIPNICLIFKKMPQ